MNMTMVNQKLQNVNGPLIISGYSNWFVWGYSNWFVDHQIGPVTLLLVYSKNQV